MSRRRSGRRSSITDVAFSYPLLLTESLGSSFFPGRLRSGDILELLGQDEEERIETVAAMLRRSSDQEVSEFVRIGQAAVLRVSQERAQEQGPGPVADPVYRRERRRDQSALERRPRRRRNAYWV